MNYALLFLMVFSCNAWEHQIDHSFEEEEEIIRFDDEDEKTISPSYLIQLTFIATFLYDSTSLQNGKFIFTPVSTCFKWFGNCSYFMALLLKYCNI